MANINNAQAFLGAIAVFAAAGAIASGSLQASLVAGTDIDEGAGSFVEDRWDGDKPIIDNGDGGSHGDDGTNDAPIQCGSDEELICSSGAVHSDGSSTSVCFCEKRQEDNDQTFCNADVYECHDGSWVGRNPDRDCQFDECPKPSASDPEPKPAPSCQMCGNFCVSVPEAVAIACAQTTERFKCVVDLGGACVKE